VIIDLPAQFVVEISVLVSQNPPRGLFDWDFNRRSPAHTAQVPRQQMISYFDPNTVSMMDLALIVKAFRQLTTQFSMVFVGSHVLFKDTTSFVVKYCDIQGLEMIAGLIQECVLVSRRKAIITTLAPKNMFEPILTNGVHDAPLACIQCIRFRIALGLKNTIWVKPALTDVQINKAKQQASHQSKPDAERQSAELLTQLRVEGLPQAQHTVVCEELMGKISAVTNMFFVKSNNAKLQEYEWEIGHRVDGSFNQQICVQLPNLEALRTLTMHVHGSGIQVGGRNLVVEVRSSHPQAALAGMCAANLSVSPGERGQCL
jgi:hypothetical protein